MTPTTIKATLTAIRATGAHARREQGVWRINLPNGTEATAYYTDDNEDAILTAHDMMAREMAQQYNNLAQKPTSPTLTSIINQLHSLLDEQHEIIIQCYAATKHNTCLESCVKAYARRESLCLMLKTVRAENLKAHW